MADADTSYFSILSSFGLEEFSTKDFIEKYKLTFPLRWADIEAQYGVGGRGSGNYRSAFTHIAFLLNAIARKGELTKLDYRPAPQDWGSPVIRYWSRGAAPKREGKCLFPDEADENLIEGDKLQVLVNRHERNPKARRKCIEYYGLKCQGCCLDFEQKYGLHGAGFIHVHHLTPISEQDGPYEINPIKDLRPLCANCHAMIHYREPMLTIEALRSLVQ